MNRRQFVLLGLASAAALKRTFAQSVLNGTDEPPTPENLANLLPSPLPAANPCSQLPELPRPAASGVSQRLLPGFAGQEVASGGVTIRFWTKGEGPPLLLVHGHPETHVTWHKIASKLAEKYTVVLPDLRGYGDSSKPPYSPESENYSFRKMTEDQIAVMAKLGHKRFMVAGHDRGGRVVHRLCLDHPDAVIKASVLDIAPTLTMYSDTSKEFATKYVWWFLQIQPAPMPEQLISMDPVYYLRDHLAVQGKTPGAVTPEVMAEYIRCYSCKGTIRAVCEDYRAAAGIDLADDRTSDAAGQKIKAPLLALWGAKGTGPKLHDLIAQVCDEILAGQHHDMFPLHVWMTGSGTQFNMNVNEVISNRCCQIAGTPLGSKTPVHPNDHVNMSQSSNDSFPSAMNIAAAVNVKQRLVPAVKQLRDAIAAKAKEWDDVVKIGRTHMQDATPLTLGQEWSGYEGALTDDLDRIEDALKGIYRLALGGTAVGTGINSAPGFAEAVAAEIAKLTKLPFVTAPNKFAVQGAHDAQVRLSATLKTLAVSLYKIANDIRLMSCGPRAGFAELKIPENEPGSSIMPGKVNPTQAEALTMVAVQVMANDTAVAFGGAGGYLEMNVYKPLIIYNVTHSISLMADSCTNFRKFLVEGTKPNTKKINQYVEESLMLVTALSPVIGYDKASKIAHYAMDNDRTLKAAAFKLGFVTEAEFDRVVDPKKMVAPYVATAAA